MIHQAISGIIVFVVCLILLVWSNEGEHDDSLIYLECDDPEALTQQASSSPDRESAAR